MTCLKGLQQFATQNRSRFRGVWIFDLLKGITTPIKKETACPHTGFGFLTCLKGLQLHVIRAPADFSIGFGFLTCLKGLQLKYSSFLIFLYPGFGFLTCLKGLQQQCCGGNFAGFVVWIFDLLKGITTNKVSFFLYDLFLGFGFLTCLKGLQRPPRPSSLRTCYGLDF